MAKDIISFVYPFLASIPVTVMTFPLKRVKIAYRHPNSPIILHTLDSIQRSPCASLESYGTSGILSAFFCMGNLLLFVCFGSFVF